MGKYAKHKNILPKDPENYKKDGLMNTGKDTFQPSFKCNDAVSYSDLASFNIKRKSGFENSVASDNQSYMNFEKSKNISQIQEEEISLQMDASSADFNN